MEMPPESSGATHGATRGATRESTHDESMWKRLKPPRSLCKVNAKSAMEELIEKNSGAGCFRVTSTMNEFSETLVGSHGIMRMEMRTESCTETLTETRTETRHGNAHGAAHGDTHGATRESKHDEDSMRKPLEPRRKRRYGEVD